MKDEKGQFVLNRKTEARKIEKAESGDTHEARQ